MTYNENNEPYVDLRRMLIIVEDKFKNDILDVAYGILIESDYKLTRTECSVLSMELCDKIPDKTYKPNFPINEEHFEAFVLDHARKYIKERTC